MCPVLCVLLHSVSITNHLVCVNEILFVNSEVFSWATGWPLQGLSQFLSHKWVATTFPLNGMPRYGSSPPDILSEVSGESTLFDQKASALIIMLSTVPSNHSCNNQPLLSGCKGNTIVSFSLWTSKTNWRETRLRGLKKWTFLRHWVGVGEINLWINV